MSWKEFKKRSENIGRNIKEVTPDRKKIIKKFSKRGYMKAVEMEQYIPAKPKPKKKKKKRLVKKKYKRRRK